MNKVEVIRCSSCGSTQIEDIGEHIGKCSHCGSKMLLPSQNPEIVSLLNSAYVYRQNYNYDLAIKSYQYILEKDASEVAAYEGLLLSKYGIEYVKDSYSGRLVPTCHRAHFKSVYEDEYYQTLLNLLNDEQKQIVEQKAKDIDKLQKSIERQLKNEQSYDIFISYKATDKNGDKTEDSVIAREIYEELTKKNYKVFLAEKSLEDRLGNEYEPIIFKALHTSKLFILVGTSKENVESNWVRNEWSRFIDRIKNNEDLPKGCFIPVFKGMNPYDMPKVHNTLVQGVDAGKIGFMTTLVDGVTRLLKPEKEQKVLETFSDIDNFAEFEKIKKSKTKELKRRCWTNLKSKKGIKKWLYLLFLYSPCLLGSLLLIMSCLRNSHFMNNPAFWIHTTIGILAILLTIICICVHIPKFGMKLWVNVLTPALLLSMSTLLFFVFLTPKTTNNYKTIFFEGYHEKGLVFHGSKNYPETIEYLLEDDYAESVQIIDGKKTLILPDAGRNNIVETVNLALPNDIECIVLPKHALSVYLAVQADTLKEIYCYGTTNKDATRNTYISVYDSTNQETYQHYTVYYENVMQNAGYHPYNDIMYIQKDLPFYD